MVLLCGWLLGPIYGTIAAGLGPALADIFSGYVVYAPATFVIKALMALVAYLSGNCFRAPDMPHLCQRRMRRGRDGTWLLFV